MSNGGLLLFSVGDGGKCMGWGLKTYALRKGDFYKAGKNLQLEYQIHKVSKTLGVFKTFLLICHTTSPIQGSDNIS